MSQALDLTIVRGDTPLHRQIADQIQAQIASGLISSGTRLPTVRSLALATGVSRVTVLQAYEVLKKRGYVRGVIGSGTFVDGSANGSALRQQRSSVTPCGSQTDYSSRARAQGIINLAQAEADPEFFDWKEFIAGLLRSNPGSESERGLFGLGRLLTSLSAHYSSLGFRVSPDETTVTGGAVATNAVLMTVGCPQGSKVIVQTPAFPFAEDYFASFQIEPVGVAAKDGDLDLDRFEDVAKRGGVSAAFLFPACNQVTGESASLSNKKQIIGIAERYGISLYEDVSAFWVRANGQRPEFLSELSEGASVDVVSFDCFGKTLSQKINVAAVFARGHVRQRIAVRSLGLGSAPSELMQGCLASYIKSLSLSRHLARALPRYLSRRNTLLTSLPAHMPKGCTWSRPTVGYVAEIQLPTTVDAKTVCEKALEAGVSCTPASMYSVGQRPHNALRIAYGAAGVDAITVAAKHLGRIVDQELVNSN